MSENLSVRIAVQRGLGAPGLHEEAARQLAAQILKTSVPHDLPVRGLILLATADWCQEPKLPGLIRQSFSDRLGYSVPLIGASMAKLCLSTEYPPIFDDGLILVALCSSHLWMTVDCLANPHDLPDKERRQRIDALAKKLQKDAGIRLGSSAERYLMGFFPGIFREAKGQAYRDNELHEEVLYAFRNRWHVFGAGAGNGLEGQDEGYQFANDELLVSGLALGFLENDLSTGALMDHGFTASKATERVSVDAFVDDDQSGYEIAALDGMPARQRLEELMKRGESRLSRPVLGLPCGHDFHIVIPLPGYEGPEGAVRVNRKLQRGDRLYVLDVTAQEMMKVGAHSFEAATHDTRANPDDWCLILSFCCSGRFEEYTHQGMDWNNSVARMFLAYPGIPIVGGLCAGECGTDMSRRARANNMSISTCCITRKWARHSSGRELQERLLDAAAQIASCKKPQDVMQTALACALAAGAKGGQICVVDRKIGRILGRDLGFAMRAKDAPYDWPKVHELTDHPAPIQKGGAFPAYLFDLSMPVGRVENIIAVPKLPPRVNILTLAVQTQRAIFVPDSEDWERYFCNQRAVKAGKLDSQLVIPIVGSEGDVIATMQLSVGSEGILDRDNFCHWLGFAYRLASVLERAQEAEERAAMECISSAGNEILMEEFKSPSPGKEYEWCGDYLGKCMKALGADGAYLRLLRKRLGGVGYQLVGAVGDMAEILGRAIPFVRRYDGERPDQLAPQNLPLLGNTRDEIAPMFKEVLKSAPADHQFSVPTLERNLSKIQSAYAIPLIGQDGRLGVLVVYSHRPYFFTERRQRIAEQAAERCCSLLLAKKAAFERTYRDLGREWLLRELATTSHDTAITQLRRVLVLACDAISADVASVFLWHNTPQRLVLQAAHNWAVPGMEGIASYERDEGWTGHLASLDPRRPVEIVTPAHEPDAHCLRKYFEYMIPVEQRCEPINDGARIGIRLGSEEDLIGVATFHYYPDHIDALLADENGIRRRLYGLEELLTPSLLAVRQEIANRANQLHLQAQESIWRDLIQATQPDASWQSVMDTVRKAFEVECASLYYISSFGKFERIWTSGILALTDAGPPELPASAVSDMLEQEKRDTISEYVWTATGGDPGEKDPVKFRCIAAVASPGGRITGFLDLINRIETSDHPFDVFDDLERMTAREVARALGAAINYREHEIETDYLQLELTTAMRMGAALLTSTSVMHEIKTPLAEIQQSVDWLKLHPDCVEKERLECLDEIVASCRRAGDVIRQAAQRRPGEVHQEDLCVIVDQAVRQVWASLPPAGLKLEVYNTLHVTVSVDPLQIVLAFVNLFRNAIEATNNQGVVRISTGIADDSHFAEIRVYNSGRCYSEEEVMSFFEIGRSSKGGLGYGLSIAKQSVESARGEIVIECPPAGGVEVVVRLPREERMQVRPPLEKGE